MSLKSCLQDKFLKHFLSCNPNEADAAYFELLPLFRLISDAPHLSVMTLRI